jgi:hypothetical protein
MNWSTLGIHRETSLAEYVMVLLLAWLVLSIFPSRAGWCYPLLSTICSFHMFVWFLHVSSHPRLVLLVWTQASTSILFNSPMIFGNPQLHHVIFPTIYPSTSPPGGMSITLTIFRHTSEYHFGVANCIPFLHSIFCSIEKSFDCEMVLQYDVGCSSPWILVRYIPLLKPVHQVNRAPSERRIPYLVGGLEHFFPIQLGMIIPTFIFFRGVGQPPTSKSPFRLVKSAPSVPGRTVETSATKCQQRHSNLERRDGWLVQKGIFHNRG